jgi:hypothetical protein
MPTQPLEAFKARLAEVWARSLSVEHRRQAPPRGDIALNGSSACSASLFREGTDGGGTNGPPGRVRRCRRRGPPINI